VRDGVVSLDDASRRAVDRARFERLRPAEQP
jgi:hypothetical protein